LTKLRVAKRPFNIHAVLRCIRLEVKRFADAAMFDLAAQGYASPFHQLVACIISVRTRDEVSLPTAIRLFEAAPTAEAISGTSVAKIAALIRPSSFYETKAYNIRDLAKRVVEEYGGKLPCDFDGVAEHR
jgi:endonuclease-3